MSTRHDLPVTPDGPAVLHGRFDERLPPALVVDSGDVVVTRTLDSGWHAPEQPEDALAAAAAPAPAGGVEHLAPWPARDPALDPGHALTGPVAVRGARPGDVLEVRVLALRPGPTGFTTAGSRATFADRAARVDALPREALVWRMDDDRATAVDQHGDRVALAPFLGVVGTCPAGRGPEPGGSWSTVPPRRTGGNLDCRELVAGSSLLLPVEVDGALLSVGDGHGAQGDGEVAGVALECAMERVELQLVLHREPPLALPAGARVRPWASTPAGDLVLGLGASVDEAAADALDGAVDLLVARTGGSRQRALALASVGVDLRVTQVVNGGVHGVHALLARDRLVLGRG